MKAIEKIRVLLCEVDDIRESLSEEKEIVSGHCVTNILDIELRHILWYAERRYMLDLIQKIDFSLPMQDQKEEVLEEIYNFMK